MTGSTQNSPVGDVPEEQPDLCGVAFKEWAAVCLALGVGEQILILRKGGLHEGAAGFRVAHRRFWLYPTRFHEEAAHLSPAAAKWLEPAQTLAPPAGELWLRSLVEVTDVVSLPQGTGLDRLAAWHGWSAETVHSRFHYREPGLFALVVRVWMRSTAWILPETTVMAGCRSWVDLPTALPTTDLHPVLPPEEFEIQRQALCAALQQARAG
jgi:hypothetical protein